MKLLANENVFVQSVAVLRQRGHDIVSIAEQEPGIDDAQVLKWAEAEERILITHDRDYGKLIYHVGLRPPRSVLYLRFMPCTLEEPGERVAALLSKPEQLEGQFCVIERDLVRLRPLPRRVPA